MLHCHCHSEARGGPCRACQPCKWQLSLGMDNLLYPGPDSTQHPLRRTGRQSTAQKWRMLLSLFIPSALPLVLTNQDLLVPAPVSNMCPQSSRAWPGGGERGWGVFTDVTRDGDRRVAATSADQTTAVPTTFCWPGPLTTPQVSLLALVFLPRGILLKVTCLC